MTDAERWRTVAAWFEEAARTGDFTRPEVECGLCGALRFVPDPDPQAFRYASRAHKSLDAVTSILSEHWPNFQTRAGACFRATLALLMAHMAEDDGGNHREDAP